MPSETHDQHLPAARRDRSALVAPLVEMALPLAVPVSFLGASGLRRGTAGADRAAGATLGPSAAARREARHG